MDYLYKTSYNAVTISQITVLKRNVIVLINTVTYL